MNNAVRPKLRKQLHPEVIEILERHDPDNHIPHLHEPNYDELGAPLWNGPSEQFYVSLLGNQDDLDRFIGLLRADFPSFCGCEVKIRAKRIGRIVPFFFNRGQVKFWELIVARLMAMLVLFIVVLKARQFGISTFVLAWIYWHVWRLSDEAGVAVGDSEELIKEFVDRISVIHDELPDIDFFKPELRQKTSRARVPKKQLEYVDRRTKIMTFVADKVKVGLVGKHFLLSEFAKYRTGDALIEDLEPMLPAIGSPARLQCSLFIESTPRGRGAFHELWKQAKAGDSEYAAFFLPWFVLEDEYSVEPPDDWKPEPWFAEFWRRCTHERRKYEGLEVTRAQIYWYWLELQNKDFDQDKMDRQYPTDDETCFLLGNESVFRRQLRFVKECVQDAERRMPAMWRLRNVKIPKLRRGYPSAWRGELKRLDPNDPRHEVTPPNPYSNAPPPRFRPIFFPMMDETGKVDPKNKGRLWTWAPPLPGHIYVAGIDASGGVGGNDSVVWVLDIVEGIQVAEFVDPDCGPEELADVAVTIGYWYNEAVLYPEVNSIGSVTMKRARIVWRYRRIGLEEKWDEVGLKKNKFGYYMTPEAKRILVLNLRWMIAQRYLRIASDRMLSQMSTFEKVIGDDGEETYGCEAPDKDDTVIAGGLACIVIRQSPKYIGYVKPRAPLPSPSALGMNDTADAEAVAFGEAVDEDPQKQIAAKLPKVLQDLLNSDRRRVMPADPFEAR